MREWSLKRKLYSYPMLERDLPELIEKIQMERARLQAAYGVSSPAMSGMPGNAGPGDPCASAVINRVLPYQKRVMDMEARLEEQIEVMREVERFMGNLDALEQPVFRMRYFNRCSWDEISVSERISRTTLWRIHEAAMERFERLKQLETS